MKNYQFWAIMSILMWILAYQPSNYVFSLVYMVAAVFCIAKMLTSDGE